MREVVPQGYVPRSLVGQWGVRSQRGWPIGTVLGEYEGRYSLGAGVNNDYVLGTHTPDERRLRFSVDPTQGGNGVCEFMNDFRLDVTRPSTRPAATELARINARWVCILRHAQPHMIVIATRNIAPGDWLLIDYGLSYWTSRAKLQKPIPTKPSH